METKLRDIFYYLFVLSCLHFCDGQRLWTFAFSNDGFPANYVENGVVVGQSVDMIMEICKFSGKKCRSALVQREQCWQAIEGFPPYSAVLNGRWFDACANLPKSPERAFSYAFPVEPFLKVGAYQLIVAENSRITLKTLEECHNHTLAYPANTALEPDCLLDSGLFVKPQKYRPVETGGNLIDVMAAIVDRVAKGRFSMGLVITRFMGSRLKGVKSLTTLNCVQELEQGLNNMIRPDDEDFIQWWNSGVKRFLCSGSRYDTFCKSLQQKYKIDPLCREPGKDIDCQKFGGPILTKAQREVTERPNPCIVEECDERKFLNYNQRGYFDVKDPTDRKPEKALQGSKDEYTGLSDQDAAIVITAKNGQLYRMDKVCITVIYAKALKFIFRGGERKGNEVNVVVDEEKKWSTHCQTNQGFRRLTRIEMRKIVNPETKSELRIRAKSLWLQACV